MALNIATYLDISQTEADRLYTLSAEEIYHDPFYQSLIAELNETLLHQTAGDARAAYTEHLNELKAHHGLSDSIMSGHTLVNWVLGYLMYPDRLVDLLDRHAAVPAHLVAETLPELLNILNDIPSLSGRQEWQRALILFALPLSC